MNQGRAHLERGWDLVSRGDLKGALRVAEKLLQLEGDTAEAHHLMGYIRMLEGHTELALEHFQHSLEINEFFLDARVHTAEILIHHLNEYDSALQLIADTYEFCETTDEMIEVLLLEADAYLLSGDIKSAQSTVARIPQEPYDHPHLTFEVGRIKFDIGDMDGSEPLLREAIARNPNNAEAHYYLAMLLEQRQQPTEATLEFLRTREIDSQASAPTWSLPREAFERRIQNALQRLPQALNLRLEGTLVIISDLPGVEIIVEGIDPRICVLMDDALDAQGNSHVARMFIYQKNIERAINTIDLITDEILIAIERELVNLFPELSSEVKFADKNNGSLKPMIN